MIGVESYMLVLVEKLHNATKEQKFYNLMQFVLCL